MPGAVDILGGMECVKLCSGKKVYVHKDADERGLFQSITSQVCLLLTQYLTQFGLEGDKIKLIT